MRDADGQQLAYVYYESEPGRRLAAKLLSKDEDRRIAVNFAKLPDLGMAQGLRNMVRFSPSEGITQLVPSREARVYDCGVGPRGGPLLHYRSRQPRRSPARQTVGALRQSRRLFLVSGGFAV